MAPNTAESRIPDFAAQRDAMIERQILRRRITDPRVIEALRRVPREEFLTEGMREFAYEDSALPIESGQTISQPYIVARMAEAAEIQPDDRVLEIGTGSGYAAAVLAEIAAEVFTIERHAELTRTAETRFRRLGYDKIQTRTGDGTQGWAEAAPFDAVLAAASGPTVPDSWRRQLKIGGRLVMPVGGHEEVQQLLLVRRASRNHFEEEMLGEVRFVPLIGAHGWRDLDDGDFIRAPDDPVMESVEISALIRRHAEPLPDIEDPGFSSIFDRYGQCRVVLLGEASHGTSEFYRARASITRRLIEKHGFNVVAVEADWPDAAVIDRLVRQREPREDAPQPFTRFPVWMWRNREFAAFLGSLRDHNETRDHDQRAGFYGLDLYNLSASIRAVIDYLEEVDPEAAKIARERYGCLTPWQNEPQGYGRMAITSGFARCRNAVVEMLRSLLHKELRYAGEDGDNFLDAAQNARLIRSAEEYYRAMYSSGAESWNLRDRHMFETLRNLLDAKGSDAKAVVWAHNSHIGDARATEMGASRGEINLGQLCREHFGGDAALIGFGTHSGTVAAANDWDGPMEVKAVKPSLEESWERLSHQSGVPNFLLDLGDCCPAALREKLLESRLQRFIGVIYRPETERWSHYMNAQLARQFDGWVWFDKSRAVTPLATSSARGEEEMWPSGL